MSNEPGNSESIGTAADFEHARRDTLCPSERADAISYDWARIGLGIALAGGAYPLVLAATFTSFGVLLSAWNAFWGNPYGPQIGEALGSLLVIGIYSVVGGTIGIFWSGLVTVFTLPIVYLFAWSLNLRSSIVWIGAFAGGLIGFICVLPVTLSVPWFNFGGDIWQVVLMTVFGPALATVLGQIGGAWGGSKSRELGPDGGWLLNSRLSIWGVPAGQPDDAVDAEPGRIQFGIRHLLWISVWLSLLLALIRLCGVSYELFLPLLLGWLLFQAATLWVGGILARRYEAWRVRRQSRST